MIYCMGRGMYAMIHTLKQMHASTHTHIPTYIHINFSISQSHDKHDEIHDRFDAYASVCSRHMGHS